MKQASIIKLLDIKSALYRNGNEPSYRKRSPKSDLKILAPSSFVSLKPVIVKFYSVYYCQSVQNYGNLVEKDHNDKETEGYTFENTQGLKEILSS